MSNIPPEAYEDCFHPPSLPIEVFCLHCQQVYDSYLIEWRECDDPESRLPGFWCCPMPGCDGKGFGFDIFPTDPEYRDEETGELMWEPGGCGSMDEDCPCKLCQADRGELDPDELDELFESGELSRENADDDEGAIGTGENVNDDAMLVGGPADAQPEFAIPMDDLLPANDAVGGAELTWEEMEEIERKIGWRDDEPQDGNSTDRPNPPRQPRSDDSESRRNASRKHRPLDDEDIPF